MRATRKRKISLLGLLKRPSLILPTLMAKFTGHSRSRPALDFNWRGNVVHSLLMCYYALFWRRSGIRHGGLSYYWDSQGRKDVAINTKFGALLFLEHEIIRKLKWKYKFKLVQVPVPQFAYAGFPAPDPKLKWVLMSIAFDAGGLNANGSSGTTPIIGSVNVAGSNRILWAGVNTETTSVNVNTQTLDDGSGGSTQSFTIFGSKQIGDGAASLWQLVAPSTSSNRRIISGLSASSNWMMVASSYTGVDQTPTLVAAVQGTSATSPKSVTVTSAADGSWMVGYMQNNNANVVISSGGSTRSTAPTPGSVATNIIGDSNADVASGVGNTFSVTFPAGTMEYIATMMSPGAVTPLISVSDTITITESVTMEETSFISVFDALTITESVSLDIANNISVSDLLTITESVTITNATLGDISVNDALSITESVTMSNPNLGDISVNDALSITESLQLEINSLINVSDDISILESVQMEVNSFISVNDTISITTTLVDIFKIDFPAGVSHMRSLANNRPYGMDTRETYRMKSNQQNRPLGMDDQTII